MGDPLREAIFIGTSREDLAAMPDEVQDVLGYALDRVQNGLTPREAKPLHGFGSGVWELRDNYQTDTYRAVYVVRFEEAIYVLHCFQKKSKSGIATTRQDREMIRRRLQIAQVEHDAWTKDE